MKLPWILAGVGIGLTAYVILNAPSPQTANGADPDVDKAAAKANTWGAKQRVTGTGGNVLGKVKEGVGNATGDDELAGKGLVDQAVGTVKDAAGKVAGAVGDTLHDANRG